MPRLTDFYAQYPDISIQLEASRQLADVARYEADLAIRFVHPGGVYPNSELLSDAPLYPFASPLLVPKPIDDPKELLNYPLMGDRTNGTWHVWFEAAGSNVPPEKIPVSQWRLKSLLAVEAAIAGQGVLLTSVEVVSHEVALGRLIQLSNVGFREGGYHCLLYTSPSPRDQRGSRMPSSA